MLVRSYLRSDGLTDAQLISDQRQAYLAKNTISVSTTSPQAFSSCERIQKNNLDAWTSRKQALKQTDAQADRLSGRMTLRQMNSQDGHTAIQANIDLARLKPIFPFLEMHLHRNFCNRLQYQCR